MTASVVSSRQWIGFPPGSGEVSRTSTIVTESVSGRLAAAPCFGLRKTTVEKRTASSLLRALRPGAAGMSTLSRPCSGKLSTCENSRLISSSSSVSIQSPRKMCEYESREAGRGRDPARSAGRVRGSSHKFVLGKTCLLSEDAISARRSTSPSPSHCFAMGPFLSPLRGRGILGKVRRLSPLAAELRVERVDRHSEPRHVGFLVGIRPLPGACYFRRRIIGRHR